VPDDTPAELADLRATVGSLRGERATTLDELARQSQAVRRNVAESMSRAAAGDIEGAAQARERADAARLASQEASGRLAQFDRDAVAAIGGLAAAIDPCDAEADVPLILLPVRLETRFTPGQDALMVRIYPDDVHVDRLDEGLDDDEAKAAVAYWDTIWAGGSEAEQDAWRALVHATRDRAPWLAWAMRPRNLAERPTPGDGGEQHAPDYPDVLPRRRGPAVARALPDRFVVAAVQGAEVRTIVGAAIPPDLPVSLARGVGTTEMGVKEGLDLPIGEGMGWLVDFGEAVTAGMAVTVPLAEGGKRVDRVLAFGVLGSLDPDAAAAELEALLTAHRFASGAAFLPQGTPTNNTDSDRAAWQRHPDPEPPATRVPAQPPAADTNLSRLASALGVDGTMLGEVAGASDREAGRARAMNTCLWQPTWNAFLDRIWVSGRLGRSIPDWARERARDFYQDFVYGRGPLAALRFGDQPYGVLPVSAIDRRWVADPGDAIEAGIVTLLHHAREVWRAAATDVPRVGDGRPIDEMLLEVLGSSPISLGLRVRSVASETTYTLMQPFIPGVNENVAFQQILDQLAWTVLGFQPGEVGLRGALGATTKPLGLPFVHDSDVDFMKALAAGQDHPGKIQSVLQALLELANGMEQAAIRDATSGDRVGELVDRAVELLPDQGIRQRLVETAGPAAMGQVSAEELAPLVDHLDLAVEPAGPSLLAELQPVASVRGSLAEAATQPDLEPAIAGRLAAQAIGAFFRGSARLAAFRAALSELTSTTLDERRVLLAETLDCASHRLDAWVTAVVAERLESIRRDRPTGAQIGAYGWVEDIEPGAGTTRDGGYIHAPSLAHAATAGILRNAYLTHNPGAEGGGAFAVDLSSARVRDALDVIDGVRQGQPLGALLGYRLERRFHELGLDRFILSVRKLAPLIAGQLTDRSADLPEEARESIAANNVVDGIKLLALADAEDLVAKLAPAPADNPYLPQGSWQAPHGSEPADIGTALEELRRTLDATSDLLLAEGVHQLVGGNLARAAAALDAASAGDAPPIEADVVRTPQRGIAFTHRDLLLLPETAATLAGWNAAAPRAAAEPRLEAWAEAQLGPATKILVGLAADGSRLTLDAAGLSALDVIYDAPDRAVLGRRLAAAFPALDVAGLWAEPPPDPGPGGRGIAETTILATSLQALVAGARPALRQAFARPADVPARTIADGESAQLRGRLSAALTELGAATDAFEAIIGDAAPAAGALGAARARLEGFGIGVPPATGETGQALARAAVAEARRRVEVAGRRMSDFDTAVQTAEARAADAAAETDPDKQPGSREAAAAAADTSALAASSVAKALFGDAFWVLPLVGPGPAPDLFDAAVAAAAHGAGGAPNGVYPGSAALRRFLRDVAGVRDGVARHAEALLFADALGSPRNLGVAQLAPNGTPGTGRWIGLPFDLDAPSPDVPVASILLDGEVSPASGRRYAGLVLDEWIETAPRRIERRAERSSPETVREANVTTGLALNANAPGARPPQAILLAVSPDGKRWTTDALIDTLEETIELAKLRVVTLERSVLAGRILPALQEQSWSLQGDAALDLGALVRIQDASKMIAFVRDDSNG
jgi:hypothetical protein